MLKGISSRDQVNVLITSEGFLLHIPDLTWALKTFFQESTPFLTKKGENDAPLQKKRYQYIRKGFNKKIYNTMRKNLPKTLAQLIFSKFH